MDTVFLVLSVLIGDLFRSAFLRVSLFYWPIFVLPFFYWPIGLWRLAFLRVSLWKDGEDEIGRCQSFSMVTMTLTEPLDIQRNEEEGKTVLVNPYSEAL